MPAGIVIARIVRPWGNRGEVVAELLTDFPERFARTSAVELRRDDSQRHAVIERHRLHQGRVVLCFAGVTDIGQAEELRGYDVVVGDDELHALPEGADVYYEFQLLDCEAYDLAGTRIGVVVDVVHGPGGDLLELRKDAGGNVLVPFVDAICVDVDVVAKRIRLDPPPGLLELV